MPVELVAVKNPELKIMEDYLMEKAAVYGMESAWEFACHVLRNYSFEQQAEYGGDVIEAAYNSLRSRLR